MVEFGKDLDLKEIKRRIVILSNSKVISELDALIKVYNKRIIKKKFLLKERILAEMVSEKDFITICKYCKGVIIRVKKG